MCCEHFKMKMKNQSNALAAAFQNIDLIKQAKEIADTSDGSALRGNEKYMNSIQGHLNKMSVAAQEFWFYFTDSKLVKAITDISTGIITITTNLTKWLNFGGLSSGTANILGLGLGLWGGLTNKFGRDRMFSLFRV